MDQLLQLGGFGFIALDLVLEFFEFVLERLDHAVFLAFLFLGGDDLLVE